MAVPAIETNNTSSGLKNALNKGTLNIADDLKGTLGNLEALDKSFVKLESTWASNISKSAKFAGSLGALGSIAVNTAFGIANVSSALNKLGSAKNLVDAAYVSVKNLVGVSKALDFSEAILGTKEFASNLKTLEESGDTFTNKLGTSLQIIFDNQAYQKWSIGAVAAYSKVESAAFKLATITTSSEQSALSAIGDRIKALRELQRETNFATNSTQTLNAQYDVASGGFASKQGQKSVGKASINLSEVGFGNVEGTNQGIVKILAANKTIGDTYRDAEKRASQLFATTKVGILTLDQLNSEAAELTSTGVGAGVAFEEIATTLALVTTQGKSASEGSTGIKALIAEIVNNVPKAQEALATLKDEAGKPIQFGFGALKEDGLIKIIERIGKATGGSRDSLNKIFSSKEASETANALLLAGADARKKFRAEIDNAGNTEGVGKFTSSAQERGKTLEGSFRASFNKSQASVEDFGAGVSENVKKNLEDTNALLGVLATRSSSAFGSFAGNVDGIASKFQAIGSFVGSVFNVIAPLAFFSFLFKNLGRLGEKVKEALNIKDGEVNVKNIGQKIEDAIVRIAKSTISRVKGIVSRVNEEIEQVGQPKAIDKPNIVPELPKKNLGVLGNISQGYQKTTGAIGKLLEVSKPVRNVIGSAAKELLSFAGGMGIVGAAIGLVGVIGGGLITSFNAIRNASSIPEVKELADNLKDLKGVEGLDDFVKSITDSRTQIQGLTEDTKILLEGLDNLKQSFNIISGKSFSSSITQEKIAESGNLLRAQTNKNQQAIVNREFNAATPEEKSIERKVNLGIILNEEDIQIIKEKYQAQVDVIEKEISGLDIAIKDVKENGGLGAREKALELEGQKKALVEKSRLEKDNIKTAEKRAVLENQLRRLQTFNSDIPVAVSAAVSFKSSSKAQFDQLKKTLDSVFTVDKIDLSKVDVNEFSKILPQLQGTLQSVTVQADIDPQGAVDSLQRLTKDIRVMQFVASDPTAQKAMDDAFKIATEKIIGYNNAVNTSYSKLFSTISGAGAVGTEAIGQATKRSLEAIGKNIAALQGKLNAPNINAQEYAETLAKIAELSSEAFTIKNSGQITEELGKRKQQLNFSQSLLDVQKNIVSLFAQESKFGSFSVSLAQSKLAVAERELAVKQESLSISAREEEITKSNILQAAQNEVKNREGLLKNVLKTGNISEKNSQSRFGINSAIDLASEKDVNSKKAQADADIKLSQEKLAKSRQFSSEGFVSIDDTQIAALQKELNSRADLLKENTKSSLNVVQNVRDLQKGRELKSLSSLLVKKDSNGSFVNLKELSALGNGEKGDKITDLAEILRASTESKENSFRSDISNAEKRKDSVTGAAGVLKDRVANIDIESAKKVVKQAEEDLKFTVVANRLKQEIGALSETIARNEAAIDASFAPQQRLIDISKGIGDSFSTLGSTASSLFSASSLGAVFGNAGASLSGKLDQVFLDANKEISKVTAKLNTIQATRDRVASANSDAKRNGIKNPELEKSQKDIERQLATAKKEADRDLQYVKQKTILEGVNASLEKFGAIAKEGADKLDKAANLANARLDLQGRKEQSKVQSNQATRGFTNSVLGLFGQNNPAAQASIARNEVLSSLDKIQSDKNEAARSGEKELNTLEVQRQQLLTENLMLTNALTQTQLLGKLVEKIDPASGVQVGDISNVNQVIGDIPKNIADAAAQTNKSLALNNETQSFVRQDTSSRIRNIDIEGRSQILSTANGNGAGLAASIDLLLPILSGGLNLVKQQPIQKIENVTPFGSSFNKTQLELKNIGGSTRETIQEQARQLRLESKKISNDFAAASPNKPQNPNSVSGQQNLSVIVNNNLTVDGVKTTFGGDNLNKVGAAVGVSGDIINKRLNEFGEAFSKISRDFFKL